MVLASWWQSVTKLPYLISVYGPYAPITRSFFQGLCALGYCIAPLDIAALISCFVRVIWVRAPVAVAAWAWCIWGMLDPP